MSALDRNTSAAERDAIAPSNLHHVLETAAADHVGGRDEQQDRVAVLRADGTALLVVADGLGGHRGGAMAAQEVIDTASEAWRAAGQPIGEAAAFLGGIRDRAHQRIVETCRRKGLQPMSTCNLLLMDGTMATWIYVGDSRLYRFRGKDLIERTRDHSMAQALLELGEIDEAEMAVRPEQTQLLSVLGADEDPEVAGGEAAIVAGDGYVICTDGMWETVKPKEMAAALAAPSLEKAAHDLVTTAVERGGPSGDNVGVAMARVVGPPAGLGQQVMTGAEQAWNFLSAPVRFAERLVGGLQRKPDHASDRPASDEQSESEPVEPAPDNRGRS